MIASPASLCPAPMPMAEFADVILRHYATMGYRPSTGYSTVRKVLNELFELTGVRPTADLTDDAIRRFRDAQPPGQSPKTLDNKHRTLGLCATAPSSWS